MKHRLSSKTLRGFTLIELLVVIAIIGILSAVVLVSLNSARTKGSDAAVQSNMITAVRQAEIFYVGNGNSYNFVCRVTGAGTERNINANMVAAANQLGSTVSFQRNSPSDSTHVTCNDSTAGWAADAPLRAGYYFCVDSTGIVSTSTTAQLSLGSSVKCGT